MQVNDISPTVSQSYSLIMSDYIHPEVVANAKAGNEAYNDELNIMMDSGTRGSGKTDKAIWEMKMEIDKGFGYYWKAVVFRKNMKDLNDIFSKAVHFFETLEYDIKINRSSNPSITFSTGEVINFAMMRNEADYNKHHGAGYQFVLFEEATLWGDITDLVYSMLSTLRSPYNEIFKKEIEAGKANKLICKMRLTTNPFGVGKTALKKTFVDNKVEGIPWVEDGITYIHMLSTYKDNPYITNAYVNSFYKLNNKEKRDAWIFADWNAKSSGAFGELYRDEIFNIKPFKIPSNWSVFHSMDWGKAEPFSVLWWAESDGATPAKTERWIDGELKTVDFLPPEGSLILIYEWYGCDKDDKSNNKGLGLNASAVAKGIKSIDKKLQNGILKDVYEIEDGVGDYSIYADNGIIDESGSKNTVGHVFEREGIYWEKCKKDRVAGVNIMHEFMNNTLEDDPDLPHIYIFGENTPYWIDNVLSLEYDETNREDVKTKGVPDHDWDATKYALMREKQYSSFSNEL